jgi:hypothetical protein
VGHLTRLERGVIDQIPFVLGPVLKEVDGVVYACDLSDQVRSILQIDRLIEGFRAHSILSLVERFQSSRRLGWAACEKLEILFGNFKTSSRQVRHSFVLVGLNLVDAPQIIRISAGLQLMKMRRVHSEVAVADTNLVRGSRGAERRAENMDAPALADSIKHGADCSPLRQVVADVDLDGRSRRSRSARDRRRLGTLLNHDTHSQPNRNANQLTQTGVVA